MSRRKTLAPPRSKPPGRPRRSALPRTPHDNVREAAAWVVERTLSSLAPSNTFLDSARARCDARDHGLLQELVRGTLRWMRRIDYTIGLVADRDFEKIEEALRAPLRVGAYQLLFLDGQPAHAVVNEAVEQAHRLTHRGGASFVNAILRRLARDPDLRAWPVRESDPVRKLAIELSHPDFLVRRWTERYGRRTTRRVLEANNRAKPIHVLAFRDRGGRELLAERLIDEGIELEPSDISPFGLKILQGNPVTTEAYERGDLYIQDEVSQLAALIPPPQPGEEILDVAAAPGGKTFALQAAEPAVRCWALDVSLERMLRMRENLARLEKSLPLLVADATAPALGRAFDRVVVDLPCSGTGTLRKHPELKWRISESEIDRLARQGEQLLEGVASLVRPGGRLVAITCSLEQEENEEVVERFLGRRTDFKLLPLDRMEVPPVGEPIVGGGFWRLLTDADHDGFTVNILHRGRGS